ncbi:hypothetical protein [Blastopirellula marina]|uniref:Uncharacterized protein n=1 Tax=Blastopirellula marina DSM 3645 TaxID=314230 RepID=A3ZL60_9BACT|nr:hypothetical protein [Blastopirellula marina]EAQ82493.1 hypothetical protein DSM3645_08847 [Blastopirellula marina DSM 3645]
MNAIRRFSRLVEVARQLPEIEPPIDDPTDEEVDNYLAAQRTSMITIRELLLQPCRNRTPENGPSWRAAFENLQVIRNLARVLLRSSEAHERRDDLAGAVDEAKYCFRLGLAVRNGGLMTDYLVSVAVEGCGMHRLRRLRHIIPRELRREIIRYVEMHEAAREPYGAIADRDAVWDANFGAKIPKTTEESKDILYATELDAEERRIAEHAFREFHSGTPGEALSRRKQQFEEPDLRILSLQRLLRIELALMIRWRESGGYYPPLLEDLAPEYLSAVPLDPHSREPYRYRLTGEDRILYGLNAQQIDHGGLPGDVISVSCGAADLFLDMDDYDDQELNEPWRPGFVVRMAELFSLQWLTRTWILNSIKRIFRV